MTAEHRIVHAHPAAGAVLDYEIRITDKDTVQPGQIRPVMLQQPVAEAVGIRFRPDPRVDVVVHLDIAHTVLLHQS
ncbi:hypothetical protein D3C75_768330 [compost metagenome]